MALHLITGYAGQEHITSADQGAYNMATFGSGNFVLDRGRKFASTVVTNNRISIADGEAMMQGRYSKMPSGTSEEVTIENGTQGKYRNDLICIRYEKSSLNSTESTKFVVIKGTESTSTATDPTYNNGTITDGDDSIADFPLYRVKLNGINIDAVQALFSVKVSMKTYMDNYQLPTASSSTLGGVKVGSGLSISNGILSTSIASKTVGDAYTPVYFSNGNPIAGKKIKVASPQISGNGTLAAGGSQLLYSMEVTEKNTGITANAKVFSATIESGGEITIREGSVTVINYSDVIYRLHIMEQTSEGFIKKIAVTVRNLSNTSTQSYIYPKVIFAYIE